MEHILKLEKKKGVDVSYGIKYNLEPLNGVGRVGNSGIDKSFTLEKIIQLAYEIKANIIIKAGPNAKWYLKRCKLDDIDFEIENQKWRDTSRCTMWIIKWQE
jgi:ABC-type dipeptide/oligopeptide/nickel transport system ATPase component